MNDINLIDSCPAHLPVQYASNMEFIRRSDTGVVIDRELHLSRTSKTRILLSHWLSVFTQALPFYTQTKPLLQLHINFKTVFP